MMVWKENGKLNMMSLAERIGRYAVVIRKQDQQAKPIAEALIQGLVYLPADVGQSITFDRSPEFSAWRHVTAGIGADARFCDLRAL